MGKRQIRKLGFLCLGRCVFTCISAENNNVKKRVAHKPVSAVDTANGLTCNIQIFNSGHTVCANVKSAVLVMEGRIYKDRLLANINSVLAKHSHHSRNSLFDSTLTVFKLNHRSIKPYTYTVIGMYSVAVCRAFADN